MEDRDEAATGRFYELDYISTFQKELVRAEMLPEGYDFEGHRELVSMQPWDVPITYADSEALEREYGFTPMIYVLAWADIHQDELMKNWELAQMDLPLNKIAPLM